MNQQSLPVLAPARVFLAVAGSLVASLAASLTLLIPTAAMADSAAVNLPQERITNGVLTQSRPTTGALLARNGNNYGLICSGTLIGCQTFMTAAHCVCAGSPFANCGGPNPASYAVYLQNVGLVGVSSIHVDPAYDFASQGDVAVLQLSAPVTGVPPTPINTTMRPPQATTVAIAGYGLTQGGADDTGILREGQAVTDLCQGQANDAAHVCWVFDSAMGAPGTDSNTCNGDSGGPLFVDFGAGELVAGITSGGVSADCLPTDISYDTDVYVHRAYIQSVGGADLANTTCGSGSQLGDANTEVARVSFQPYTDAAANCRKEIRTQYTRYATRSLKLRQNCLNSINNGKIDGPCPDLQTTSRLDKLAAKVDPARLANKCPSNIVPTVGAQLGCAGATDANDLATCVPAAADAATARMLDSEYAQSAPAAPLGSDAERSCQQGIAKAMYVYSKAALTALTKCERSLDAGKFDACPDPSTSDALAAAQTKASETITAACSDGVVQTLDTAGTFGGLCAGANSLTTLQECEREEHSGAIDDLAGVLDLTSRLTSFTVTVPAGASRLLLTLNGRDKYPNDLDLYARQGAAPTTSVYDARSENGGMFEEIDVAAPAAGTWYVLVSRYSGDGVIPFQANATIFKP